MDYPNNFNIPAFPAGKTVALTRSVSVWISIVFFLIVAACGFILLERRFATNYPFLISIDPITTEWTVVAYPNELQKPIQRYQVIQEKLVIDFVSNWFTVSKDKQINESRWTECSIEECDNAKQFNPANNQCALSCRCSADVFQEFSNNVLPEYIATNERGDNTWHVQQQPLPIAVSENDGKWQVYATITSPERRQQFAVLVFIDVARDINLYPATFGYYIKQFNSYRITQ